MSSDQDIEGILNKLEMKFEQSIVSLEQQDQLYQKLQQLSIYILFKKAMTKLEKFSEIY